MPSKLHVLHILVKDEKEAFSLLYDINHGKDFGDVAKEKSLCPSGKKGGDLGWFGKGMMVKEFETAAFGMKIGEVSKPVKTQFGWHLIKVVESK